MSSRLAPISPLHTARSDGSPNRHYSSPQFASSAIGPANDAILRGDLAGFSLRERTPTGSPAGSPARPAPFHARRQYSAGSANGSPIRGRHFALAHLPPALGDSSIGIGELSFSSSHYLRSRPSALDAASKMTHVTSSPDSTPIGASLRRARSDEMADIHATVSSDSSPLEDLPLHRSRSERLPEEALRAAAAKASPKRTRATRGEESPSKRNHRMAATENPFLADHHAILPKLYELQDFLLANGFTKYARIPLSELFKLFIDGSAWSDQECALRQSGRFDKREPGYMRAMIDAFMWGMKEIKAKGIEQGLTGDFLEELQKRAVLEVRSGPQEDALTMRGGFRKKSQLSEKFGLVPISNGTLGTLSRAGFDELRAKFRDPKYNMQFSDDPHDNGNLFATLVVKPEDTILEPVASARQPGIDKREAMREPRRADLNERLFRAHPEIVLRPPATDQILKRASDHLARLYKATDKSSPTRKLDAMNLLMQDEDQIHPGYDGNIRSFAILLSHILLADDPHMIPPSFTDPNCVDCLSIAELREKFSQGQHNFISLSIRDQ